MKTCQFLFGQPQDRNFCCKPVHRKDFCEEHYNLCWIKPRTVTQKTTTIVGYFQVTTRAVVGHTTLL